MTKWKQHIDISQYIGEDCSLEAIHTASKGVLSELAKLRPSFNSFDLESIRENFECMADSEDVDEEEFNYYLSELYDWADANRIWLGL